MEPAFTVTDAIADLGHDVFQTDTRMAGYDGITAGDVALESLRMFAALQPTRLLFSHFGPVTDIEETLDRSAAEINLWVAETRRARSAGMDLDHAAAMVAERTRQRYAAMAPDADQQIAANFDRISGRVPTWLASCTGWTGLTGADTPHQRCPPQPVPGCHPR
jgi:hypothetical protein